MRVVLRYGADRRAVRAFRARQELVKAGLTRRDLAKMGLLTGGGVGAGLLTAEKGLAKELRSTSALGSLPPLKPFIQALPVLPTLPPLPRGAADLTPAPINDPRSAPDPANGRTEPHQSRDRLGFEPQQFFRTRMAANPAIQIHPALPYQTLWGFNRGGPLSSDPAMSPGPVLVMRYGTPVLIRRTNELPPPEQNGGFGVPEVSTHLHNFHSGPDSDGGPCDPQQQRFFFRGQYYDYCHNLRRAGWDSTNKPDGDIRETLSFLWYHDHRVDHTAENTYKGLVGPAIVFNEFDNGNENDPDGFRLPSFPNYDIPLVFADKFIDPTTGLIAFDTFNTDGILGNVFLVNGKVQPYHPVQKRRYRFRLLDAGPSRFYEFFLTNPANLSQKIPFWVISNDGNLLPRPIEVTSYRVGVAERTDIIVDFKKIADRFGNPPVIRLENRLEQVNGRGPTGKILPAGQGDQLLEFRLVGKPPGGPSFDPEPVSFPRVAATATDAVFAPIALPDISQVPIRLTRTFRFERGNGGWQVNGKFMDCTRFRFTFKRNTAERWILQNNSGGWQHPIHIHLEEFRILSRNGVPVRPGNVQFSRKDVTVVADEQVELFMRFRDMIGGYPVHCHNTVHEDHQMMLIFNIDDVGDNKATP